MTGVIRAKLAAGTLPTERPSQIWMGESSGDGQACNACDQEIPRGEIEYEATVSGRGAFRFHRRCLDVWHQERARRLDV